MLEKLEKYYMITRIMKLYCSGMNTRGVNSVKSKKMNGVYFGSVVI